MSKLSPYWIRVHSGGKFDLLNPRPSQMKIEDVVWSLSLIHRFNGHTQIPYTVLNHLIVCHDLAPNNVKRECMGHDYVEAYFNDISTKLKSLLPDYQKLEYNAEMVAAKKWKLQFPYPKIVKQIDLTALAWEMKWLLKNSDYKSLPYAPPRQKLIPMDRETCVVEFFKRYNKLYK